jgi:hypothetical protein
VLAERKLNGEIGPPTTGALMTKIEVGLKYVWNVPVSPEGVRTVSEIQEVPEKLIGEEILVPARTHLLVRIEGEEAQGVRWEDGLDKLLRQIELGRVSVVTDKPAKTKSAKARKAA